MGSFGKHLHLLGMGAVLAILATACGPRGQADISAQPDAVTVDDTAGYPLLEAALLAELQRLGVDPARRAAESPKGAEHAVRDLRVELEDADGPGGAEPLGAVLRWTEVLVGDYDQNGIVQINDITPLGQFFGQAVEYETVSSGAGEITLASGISGEADSGNVRRARIDGDGNGLLNLADLTPIAVHFNQQLDGYRIYRRGPRDTAYRQLPNQQNPALPYTIGRTQSTGGGAEPVQYEFHDPLALWGGYDYIVRPFELAGNYTGEPDLGYSQPDLVQFPDEDHMLLFGEQLADTEPPVFSGSVLVIRNDNGIYNSGYDALLADLGRLQADVTQSGYYEGIGVETLMDAPDVVVWYRGGFGGTYPDPLQISWTATEQTELRTILAGNRNLLLMSQSHGSRDNFVGIEPTAWPLLGFEVLPATVGHTDTKFTHMAGLPADRAIGPGNGNGVLPVAASNLRGSFVTNPDYDDGMGRDDGEMYGGSGGRVPWKIRLPDGAQFCALGWTSQIIPTVGLGGMGAADGFQPGLFFSPYGGEHSHANAYVSWGSTKAPYAPLGVYPSYMVTAEGTARLWVIGYNWHEVQVLQDPEATGEPVKRYDLLGNVLEWLVAE